MLPLGPTDLPFHLRIDTLAGFFLLLLGAVAMFEPVNGYQAYVGGRIVPLTEQVRSALIATREVMAVEEPMPEAEDADPDAEPGKAQWQGEERWLGHRPSTVDSLPFIGPSPRAPAIHFAFGAQHVGLTSAPRTGRLIAELVAGRTPNIDISPFRVGRFDRTAA